MILFYSAVIAANNEGQFSLTRLLPQFTVDVFFYVPLKTQIFLECIFRETRFPELT